jgi:hypothetical protein
MRSHSIGSAHGGEQTPSSKTYSMCRRYAVTVATSVAKLATAGVAHIRSKPAETAVCVLYCILASSREEPIEIVLYALIGLLHLASPRP